MKRLQRRFRSLLVNHLELPSDVILEFPRITIIGQIHVYIENYQELALFTESELKLKTKGGFIQINGSTFVLKTMLPQEMLLEGTISSVHFVYE